MKNQNIPARFGAALQGVGREYVAPGLLILACVFLLGCGLHIGGVTVTPQEAQAACRVACDAAQAAGADLATTSACLSKCDAILPAPTSSPTGPVPETPTALATVSPTATEPPNVTPTATSTAVPAFQTRLRYINGFGGCNPYPCDPTTPACAAQKNGSGQTLYPVRSSCAGDRTAFYEMVGYDVVPKGTGCERYTDTGLRNKCLNNDSPYTPCNGSPACDVDHLGCPRVAVSCGGLSWDAATPSKGSQLYVLGPSCSDGANPGFAIACSAAPGTPFTICTIPWPNAKTGDGRPIIGGQQFCKQGFF